MTKINTINIEGQKGHAMHSLTHILLVLQIYNKIDRHKFEIESYLQEETCH